MEGSSETTEFPDNIDQGNESFVKSEPDDDEDVDINNLLKESENCLPSQFMEAFVNESSSGLIDPELPVDNDDTQTPNEVGPILTPFSLNFADDMNLSYEGERDSYEEEKKGVCCICGMEEGKDGKSSIKFFDFPTDHTLFKRWKEVCNMQRSSSLLPVHQWRVCSKHFTFRDYVNRSGQVSLKTKAVPFVDMPKVPWRMASPPSEPVQRVCCVCREAEKFNSTVSFYPFPTESRMLSLWKEKCGFDSGSSLRRIDWFVCSKHFSASDFYYYKGVKRLHPNSVPSIGVILRVSEGPQQVTCCVCHVMESPFSSITFHPFPRNHSMFNLWKEKCGVDVLFGLDKDALVCSRHFTIDAFKMVNGKRQLLPLAVPSIGLKQHKVSQESQEFIKCLLCKRQGTDGKCSGVSYHKFPSDPNLCLEWKKICNLSDNDDVSCLRICSKHFSPFDLHVSVKGVRSLRSGAVPRFMDFPEVASNHTSAKPFSNNAVPKRVYVFSKVSSQHSQSSVVNNTSSSPANQNTSNSILSSTLCDNKSVPTLALVGNSAGTLPVPEVSGAAPNQLSNLMAPNSRFFMMNNGSPVQHMVNGKTVFLNLNKNKSSLAPIAVGPQYRLICPNVGMPPTLQLALPHPLASMPMQSAIIRSESSATESATPAVAPALNSTPLTATGTSATTPTETVPLNCKASFTSPDMGTSPISVKDQGGSVSKDSVSELTRKKPLSMEELLRTVRQPVVLLERLVISKNGKVMPPKKQRRVRCPKNKKQLKNDIKDEKTDQKQKRSGSIGQTSGKKMLPKKCGVEVKLEKDQSGGTARKEIDKISKSDTESDEEHTKGRCYLCNWDGRRGEGNPVDLYRFPSMPGLCEKWKRICNVADGDVSAFRICSKHFRPEAFVQTKGKPGKGELVLTGWAYPSLAVPNTTALAEIDKEYSPNFDSVESPKKACFLCSYREGQDKKKTNKIKLYRFPCRGSAMNQWKQACNVYDHDYMDLSSLYICSNHFTESDFTSVGGKAVMLKPGAVPSVNVPNVSKVLGNVVSAESSVDSCDTLEEGFNPADLVEVTLNEPESPVAFRLPHESLPLPPPGGPNATPEACLTTEQIGGAKKTVFVRRYFMNPQNESHAQSQSQSESQSQSQSQKLTTDRILAPYSPLRNDDDKDAHHSQSQSQSQKLATDRILAPYSPLKNGNNEDAVPQSISNNVMFPSSSLNNGFQSVMSSKLSRTPVLCRIAQTPGAMTVSPGRFPKYQIVSRSDPPRLYIPTPPKKTVSHAACQTTAVPADKMCQTVATIISYSSDDISDKKEDTILPPPAKKLRVLSPLETCLAASGRDSQIAEKSGEKESDIVKKQLKSVQDLVIHLQQKCMLSQEACDMIMSTLTDEIQELIASKLQSDGQGKLSADLRSFALTLHFFSTEAYNYVRNIWPNLLPDPSLIRNWFSVSDGKPGFTQEVLDDIYSKSKENGGSFPCCVLVCDLPISREVFFEDGQFYGNVNLGTDQDMRQDGAFTAQTALVFFVSALHKTWCCPLGYFFISSLNARERANVLTKCLDLLHEVYANVVSITIDGSPVSISMCNCLGANFAYGKDWRPWFLDPVTQKKVLVFWDTLKMLRLVRDALGDVGCIFTQDDKIIKWSALKWLVKFQTKIHLSVFTYLTKKHVEYKSDRSNALLCRQVFSQNVCKAFQFARELQIPELRSANATDKFCMVFCHLFNMLSSENILSRRECGSCVTELTRHFMSESAESFVKYISSLKDATDVPILKSSRKTGFLGLVINLINSLELFEVLSKVGVKQLLTAKLSHEYVELFTATILQEVNGRLPNAKQFQDAYRKLVLKRAVRKIRLGPSTCLVDSIEMLHTISSTHKYPVRDFSVPISVGKFDSIFVSVVRMLNPLLSVEKYLYGFVVRKIISNGLCSLCACHLTTERNVKKILMTKASCVFVEPSSSVKRICNRTDSVFRELRRSILCGQCTKEMFVNQVFMSVCWDVFISSKMDEHILEHSYLDNHKSQLCKLIIETLFDIRVLCDKAKERKQR